jgi:hypothetical protein
MWAIAFFLSMVLAIAKLIGLLAISWLLVFAPMLFVLALTVLIAVFGFLLIFVAGVFL